MSRGWILFLAVAGVSLLTAFILYNALREPEGGFEPAPPGPPPDAPEPEPEPPPPRRPLTITGRLLGPANAPLAGWTVVLGEGSSLTDEEGRFELPAALRPRWAEVRLESAGQVVGRWQQVVTGDPEPAAAETEAPAAYDLEASLLPERPDRVRWTIQLTADRLTAAGPSALPADAWLRLEAAFVEEWGNGARIRLRGTTHLPDGAHVQASLYFNGSRFAGTVAPAEVKGREFLASLVCARETRVFSGPYEARASFNPILERPADVDAWRQAAPERNWDGEIPEVAMPLFIGDPTEHAQVDAAAQAYYTRQRVSAEALHRELKVRVAEAFAMARKAAPEERQQELKLLQRVGRSVDRQILGSTRVELVHRELFDESGKLNEEAWRRFLDVDWRPQVKALIQEHKEREQEKYPDMALALGSLLDALLDLSFGFSRFYVYPAFDLKPHENDFYPDEEAVGDLGRLETVVVEGLRKLERPTR